MESYELIINGHKMTSTFDGAELELNTKWGKPTNTYKLNIEVEEGSEADLQLKRLLRKEEQNDI